jgi:hypothetical protein
MPSFMPCTSSPFGLGGIILPSGTASLLFLASSSSYLNFSALSLCSLIRFSFSLFYSSLMRCKSSSCSFTFAAASFKACSLRM